MTASPLIWPTSPPSVSIAMVPRCIISTILSAQQVGAVHLLVDCPVDVGGGDAGCAILPGEVAGLSYDVAYLGEAGGELGLVLGQA